MPLCYETHEEEIKRHIVNNLQIEIPFFNIKLMASKKKGK